jgi:hypothetical protein
VLGTIEGYIALACSAIVLFAQTTPAQRFQVPWLFMGVWAAGLGFGVGSIRFGSPGGRRAGAIALLLLGGALVLLVLLKGAFAWDSVVEYWTFV